MAKRAAPQSIKKRAAPTSSKPVSTNKSSGSAIFDVLKGVSSLQKQFQKNQSPVVKDPLAKTVSDVTAAIKEKGQNFMAKAIETQIGMEMRGVAPKTTLKPDMAKYVQENVDLKKIAAENKVTIGQGGKEAPLMTISPEGDDSKRTYLQKYLNQRGGQNIDLNSLTLEATTAGNINKQDRVKYASTETFLKRLNGLINEDTNPETKKKFEILTNLQGAKYITAFEKNLSNSIVSEYDELLSPEERQKAIDNVLKLYNEKGKEKSKDTTEFVGESIVDEAVTGGIGPVLGGVKKLTNKLGPVKEWPGFVKDIFNKEKVASQKSKQLLDDLAPITPKSNPGNLPEAPKGVFTGPGGRTKYAEPFFGEGKTPVKTKLSKRNLNTKSMGLEDSPTANEIEKTKVLKPFVSQDDVKVMVKGKTYSSDDIIHLAQNLWDNPKTATMNLETQEIVRQTYHTAVKEVDEITKQLALDPSNENLTKKFTEMAAKTYELSNAVSMVKGVAGRLLSLQKTVPKHIAADENFRKATSSVLKNLPKEKALELNQKLLMAKGNPDELQKLLQDYTKTTFRGKLSEYMMAAMLSNPKTHIKNIMGTLVNVTSNIVRIPVESAIDATRSLLTKQERTVFLKELPAALKGLGGATPKAFVEAGQDIMKMLKGQSIQQVKTGDVGNAPQIQGLLGKFIRTPLNLLAVEDRFFKNLVRGMETARYETKLSKGVNMAPSKIEKAIDDKTLEVLFQAELGTVGKSLTKIANDSFLVKLNFPFLKTPLNIIKEGLKHTPLGFFNAFMKKGAEFPKEMSKAIVGTALTVPLVNYAFGENEFGLPNIVGPAPLEEAERDAFYRSGQIPYSIRIGDTYYSYKDVEPFSYIFSSAAAAGDNYKKNGEMDSSILTDMASAMMRTTGDKSSMRTIGEISEAFLSQDESSDFKEKMLKFGFAKVGQFIPNVIAAAGRGMDPIAREPAGALENFKGLLPGVNQSLPAKTDLFGNEVLKKNGFLGQTLLPLTTSKIELNVLDQELSRLKSPVGPPSKNVMGVELNKKAYNQMKVMRGQKLQETVWNIMNSPEYGQMNDAQRSDILKTAETQIDKATGMLFFLDNPTLLEESFMNNEKNQINLYKEIVPLLDPNYRGMSEGQLEDMVKQNLDQLNTNFQTTIENGELRKNLIMASEINLKDYAQQ